MTRRDCLHALSAGALTPALSRAQSTRPNFVFIFCDDMGWGDLPVYGHRNVNAHGGWIVRGELKTPRIDRMAAEGTLFTQFYVSSPVCSPSRAGLMTGRFPAEVGVHDYLASPELNRKRGCVDYLDPTTPTLTKLLHDAGYATGHFGKWHLGSGPDAPKPEAYGIDRYRDCRNGPGGRPESSGAIADETIRFIEENRDRPFYINAWLYDPHSPLRPTAEMLAQYRDLNPRWGEHLGALQIWYAVISYIDKQVGRILDKLDEAGLSEDTIVIFSSDNGPESGLIPFVSHYGGASSSGPFRGLKRSLYEGGIREPFLVRWKSQSPAGRVDDETVFGGTDYLPTVLSLAGVEPPEGLPGQDLSASFRGRGIERSKPLMWENRFPVYGHVLDKSPILAIRDGRWKLLLNPDRSRVELFDIPNDPTEMNNLAGEQPAVVARLSERVLGWQKTLPEGPIDPAAGQAEYAWPD